ncbi:hypothetical protein K523DRAFT_337154 [Schizophyllum commune Tattone D]|nr:hypothetical protein K523DRAFT_337154 [Schizophyllum commune Tattone D]
MTLPPTRSVLAITRTAPIVHDRVLVRPSMCGLSRAARPRLGAARLRRCSLSPPKAARTDYHHELARLRPSLARPPAEGCTRALRSLRAPAFGPVALSSVARRRALRSSSSVLGQRRVVMIPLLSRYLPSRLRCTSLLDIFHSLDRDDVI